MSSIGCYVTSNHVHKQFSEPLDTHREYIYRMAKVLWHLEHFIETTSSFGKRHANKRKLECKMAMFFYLPLRNAFVPMNDEFVAR